MSDEEEGAFNPEAECLVCFEDLKGNPFICTACSSMACNSCVEMLKQKGTNDCTYCFTKDTLISVYDFIGQTDCFNCGFSGKEAYFDKEKNLKDACQMCGIGCRNKPEGWTVALATNQHANRAPNACTMKYVVEEKEQES